MIFKTQFWKLRTNLLTTNLITNINLFKLAKSEQHTILLIISKLSLQIHYSDLSFILEIPQISHKFILIFGNIYKL